MLVLMLETHAIGNLYQTDYLKIGVDVMIDVIVIDAMNNNKI